MDPIAAALVVVAGAAMGFINNLAGAGGLLGLLAFDLACGLPPEVANPTLRPAALAIGGAGMLGFIRHGRRIPPRAWAYGACAVPGAVLGAAFAVELPVWVYRGALLAIVAALIAQQVAGRGRTPAPPRPASAGGAALWFTLLGVHMGFLQVAFGLVAIIALSRVLSRDLVEVNAAKMALIVTTAVASNGYLAAAGAIAWTPALLLAAGAAAGSFAASRFSVRRGHGAVRAVVLAVCAIVAVRVGWQWLAR